MVHLFGQEQQKCGPVFQLPEVLENCGPWCMIIETGTSYSSYCPAQNLLGHLPDSSWNKAPSPSSIVEGDRLALPRLRAQTITAVWSLPTLPRSGQLHGEMGKRRGRASQAPSTIGARMMTMKSCTTWTPVNSPAGSGRQD